MHFRLACSTMVWMAVSLLEATAQGQAIPSPSAAATAPRTQRSTAAPTPPPVLTLAHRTDLELSVDVPFVTRHSPGRTSHGATIREVRSITLAPGRHQVRWEGLPNTALLETTAVSVASGPPATRLLSYRLTAPQLSAEALQALREEIPVSWSGDDFETPAVSPPHGKRRKARTDKVVQSLGGELTVVPRDPAGAQREPPRTLTMELEIPSTAAAPTKVDVELTLLLSGVIQPAPEYVLHVDPATGKARLSGAVVVSNLSGYPLEGARVIVHPQEDKAFWLDFSHAPSPSAVPMGTSKMPFLGPRSLFVLPAPLAFDGHAEAHQSIVQGADLPTTRATIALLDVHTLHRHADSAEDREHHWPVYGRYVVNASSLGLPDLLPDGNATMWVTNQRTATGRGTLEQPDAATIHVTALDRTTMIRSMQRQARVVGRCHEQATWRFFVPRSLLEERAVDLIVNRGRDHTKVTVSPRSVATVVAESYQTIVRVAAIPRASAPAASNKPAEPVAVDVDIRTDFYCP